MALRSRQELRLRLQPLPDDPRSPLTIFPGAEGKNFLGLSSPIAGLAAKIVSAEGELMDHLQQCMNALRRTSSDAEQFRVYLIEAWIDRYRQNEAANETVALNQLLEAINKEAEQHPGYDFWITVRAYVERCLRELEPEEPLPPPY